MSEGFVSTEGFEEGIGRVTVGPRERERRSSAESVAVVTGGGGFVGCHVVRALLDSGRERVIGFDVNEPSPEGRFVIGGRIGRRSSSAARSTTRPASSTSCARIV